MHVLQLIVGFGYDNNNNTSLMQYNKHTAFTVINLLDWDQKDLLHVSYTVGYGLPEIDAP